jgi:hypothetical protein
VINFRQLARISWWSAKIHTANSNHQTCASAENGQRQIKLCVCACHAFSPASFAVKVKNDNKKSGKIMGVNVVSHPLV